ncbi:SGNH/GDSL hydrolase family protein [Spirosoma sp. RP8]|uniref:SGNH/GDSL hydrolase family protein n=1 Tax=Spirosoma liriopis TaxID=2937440 RepID=A0ABT0HI80_9BACT|nr:SGNH/GDSL hydrolase family protein [Spirosoma liriopis]MCK8491710.1 SGNH/GDSL hydrolase family protein [Spirosoma liriopis]
MATNPIIQILILTLFLACTAQTDHSLMIANPDASQSHYTFLSLGDSYTIGESVSESARWSVQLADLLRKDGLDIAKPDIIARTGWTTAELQDAIKASGNQKTYDLVSLLIGVNNQYRGQSKDRYQTELRQLLQTATRFAGGKANHVFVLSIPDWGQSPYAQGRNQKQITEEIDAFNAIAEQECKAAGIAYVNITPITRQAADDDNQFASDGLHYSSKQMRQWAEAALPTAKSLLDH